MDARRRKEELPREMPEASSDPRRDTLARPDLEKTFALLAPAERAALTACYALGFSHEEGASLLRMPLGTLKSHIARGREKLQGHLQDWETDP